MRASLSWLKEYVDIDLKPKELADRLTEVGLGVEKIEEKKSDVIFELEITPNRPDCLSIIGIAREIAAIEGKSVRYPKLKTNLKRKAALLPLKIHPNFSITPRLTGIIIDGVKVQDSPAWLVERLESMGQKPINTIVDITNYVMWELGNPIHSFDYHKIVGAQMWVKQAKGGESFESVDEISYRLPKGAIIFEDTKKIFDLVGIKGGKNSGTYKDTKAVFITVEVDDPILIRRASQALSLRSDASAIFERAVNRGGTVGALKRTVDLILEAAGGEIASELIDLREQEFNPWKVSVREERIKKLLGVDISQKEIAKILTFLNLHPVVLKDKIECTIPTYRNDLKIEEDLIEEVARQFGYNKFPKTIPSGPIPTKTVPYFKDYRLDEKIKNILKAAGFSETYTYSLVSEQELVEFGINPDDTLRVDNPVSREYEYLRPTLRPNMIKALRYNKGIRKKISLFELGRVFLGKTVDTPEEIYELCGITNEKNYLEVKGILERLFEEVGTTTKTTIDVVPEGVVFKLNITELLSKRETQKLFKPIPKYPSIIEDLAFTIHEKTKIGNLQETIRTQSALIAEVELLDTHKDTVTFHLVYQSKERNLKTEEVREVREKIAKSVEKLGVKLKD